MNLVYAAGYFLSKTVFDLFFPGEVAGVENIPRSGPFIIAANHASFFDPPAIGCRVPRELHYFARKTLFKPGLPEKILHKVNAIPVDLESESDISSLKTVLRILKEGHAIVLFPEGTRTADGDFQPARAGVGLIACKSGVPVIPARIFGSYEAYGRHQKRPKRNAPISVIFGQPLFPDKLAPDKAKGKDRYQAVAEAVMDAIRALPPPPRVEL